MFIQRVISSVFLSIMLVFGSDWVSGSVEEKRPWMCGPYSLSYVAETYGVVIKPEVIAKLARTTEAGTTMKGLADAAYQLGMKTVGRKTNYQNLLKLKPPLIALVKTKGNSTVSHFIVVDKVEYNQVEIWDVNQGYAILSKRKFESIWGGYVLIVSPPLPKREVPADAPDIEINEPIYDFGTIAQMEKVKHTFIIRNVGKKPLEILKVNSPCNCETTNLKDKLIPPGQSTMLDVQYHGSTNSGKTRIAVYLTTNDPDEPQVVVSLVGVIVGVIGVYPKHFYLGEIGQEESVRKSFVIHRPKFGLLKVKLVESSSPYIHTKLEKLNDKDLIARVHFEIKPGLPIGPLRETITVYTDAAKYPEIRVSIEGTVTGDLRVEPNQFFMGFLQVDTPVRRIIIIEKRGEADLEILKVENDLTIVQIRIVPLEPGRKYQIEAICTPTASSQKLVRDEVRIYTNSKKQPFLKIPLYGLLTAQ